MVQALCFVGWGGLFCFRLICRFPAFVTALICTFVLGGLVFWFVCFLFGFCDWCVGYFARFDVCLFCVVVGFLGVFVSWVANVLRVCVFYVLGLDWIVSTAELSFA